MKTYIQIGTNNGNDAFNKRCNDLTEKSKIVLIEPHKTLRSEIEKNYDLLSKKHDITIINKAIVTKEDIKNIDLYCTHINDGLSSVINRRTYDRLSVIVNVETITFNTLLKDLGISHIDELHIDAEGLDYEILLSINLENINIELITCEIWSHDEDDKNNIYRTGPSMIGLINEKYSNYTISQISIEDMPSLKFIKKKDGDTNY